MNPLEPHDPLWKLLGKSRGAEVRPSFVQNVVREARNTAQERGWRARLRAWWTDSEAPLPMGRLIAVAAMVVVAGWAMVAALPERVSVEAGPLAVVEGVLAPEVKGGEVPLVQEVETQLESLDYLDALLAVEDTSGLTDSEIAYFLY
jgi:hypothetical protein